MNKQERLSKWNEKLKRAYEVAQKDLEKYDLESDNDLLLSVQINVLNYKDKESKLSEVFANTGFNDVCTVKEFNKP